MGLAILRDPEHFRKLFTPEGADTEDGYKRIEKRIDQEEWMRERSRYWQQIVYLQEYICPGLRETLLLPPETAGAIEHRIRRLLGDLLNKWLPMLRA